MKGICTLSNIPVRKEADSRSEIISMLLFGETYRIKEEKNGWAYIVTDDDTYEGWIGSRQSEPLFSDPGSAVIVTAFPFVLLQSEQGTVMAPCSSRLPGYHEQNCTINGTLYKVTEAQQHTGFHDLAAVAKKYLNVPYLWGGRTPFGIDCSGFTQAVYKCAGMQLLRDARQQAEMGQPVSSLEEAKTGDLAFFDNATGHITHVGMMLGNQTIIHASGKVRIDAIDNNGIISPETNNYSHHLNTIKRLIP